jgi:hypothetical protein
LCGPKTEITKKEGTQQKRMTMQDEDFSFPHKVTPGERGRQILNQSKNQSN